MKIRMKRPMFATLFEKSPYSIATISIRSEGFYTMDGYVSLAEPKNSLSSTRGCLFL